VRPPVSERSVRVVSRSLSSVPKPSYGAHVQAAPSRSPWHDWPDGQVPPQIGKVVSAHAVPAVHVQEPEARSRLQLSPAGHAPFPQSGNASPHAVGGIVVVVAPIGSQAHTKPLLAQVSPAGQVPPQVGGRPAVHGNGGTSVVVVVLSTGVQLEPPGGSHATLGSFTQPIVASKSRRNRPGPGSPPVLLTAPLVVGGMQKIVLDCAPNTPRRPSAVIGSV
jgi:hypothetical protein